MKLSSLRLVRISEYILRAVLFPQYASAMRFGSFKPPTDFCMVSFGKDMLPHLLSQSACKITLFSLEDLAEYLPFRNRVILV